MVAFQGSFDVVKLEECLRYVRDSLDWLLVCEEERQVGFGFSLLHRLELTGFNFLQSKKHISDQLGED